MIHSHILAETVRIFLIEDFVGYNEKGETTVPMIRPFTYVVFVSDMHALCKWNIIVFPDLIIVIAITGQRIEQSSPFEGFIENSKIFVVLIQETGSQAGVGDYHLIHWMYHTVFYGIVFQFIDDDCTPIDDTECHTVRVDRVTVGHNNYRKVKLVTFLMSFGKIICI